MKFKSRTLIEISGRFIKIFQASLKNNTCVLNAGYMINIENLGDEAIIQKLLEWRKSKHLDLTGSEIILSIPRQYLILRYLNLPAEDPQELRTMLDLQAANNLPFAKEEAVIDFIPLHKNNDGYTKVLLTAISLETALRFEKILESARIQPHQMTAGFIGQWQCYRQHVTQETSLAVIFDIDTERSEICICDQNNILFSRSTIIGIREIDTKNYDEFLKQMDLTMAAYVKEQVGSPIGKILLLSSMGNIEGLKEHFQRHYTIPVQIVKTLQDVPVKKNFAWPSFLLQECSSVTPILGLLRTSQPIPVDLIPSAVKSSQASVEGKAQGIRLGVAAFAAFLSIAFCLSLNFFKYNNQLSTLERKVKSEQKKAFLIKQKEQQLRQLKETLGNRIIVVDIIKEIHRFISKNIVLTNISLAEDSTLSLQGYTPAVSDINDMQRAFVGSVYFDSVNLNYVNKRSTLQGELNYFKITCHIKRRGQSVNEEAQ